jgi:hypothetical protein
MHRAGTPKTQIAKKLHVSFPTISKVIWAYDRGDIAYVESTPLIVGERDAQDPQVPAGDGAAEYNPVKALGETLGLIGSVKRHLRGLADAGSLPTICTPTMIEQLARAERTVLLIPGDLNKGRRDLYEQIQSRNLDGHDLDDDIKQLGAAGNLGDE